MIIRLVIVKMEVTLHKGVGMIKLRDKNQMCDTAR
jgi:hypothetical protein